MSEVFRSQLSGDESLVDKWILSRLNDAAKVINQALTDRAFNVAASRAFEFWLYELCDVYIVSLTSCPSGHLFELRRLRNVGSDKAYYRSQRPGTTAASGPEHSLHVSGSGFPVTPSVHAIRD